MIYKKFEFKCLEVSKIFKEVNNGVNYTQYALNTDYVYQCNRQLEEYYKKTNKSILLLVYDSDEGKIKIITAYRADAINEKEIVKITNKVIRINTESYFHEEITNSEFMLCANRARVTNLLYSSVDTLADRIGINIEPRNSFFEPKFYDIEERLFNEKLPSLKESLGRAKAIMASDNLIKELKRIYSSQNIKEYYGHPVHYYITAGTWSAALDIIDVLIPALMKNKRLISKRVTYMNNVSYNASSFENYENVFGSNVNSTLVIDLSGKVSVGKYATGYRRNAEFMSQKLAELGKDELFIFVEIIGDIAFKDETLASILGGGDIVKIDEGFGDFKEAKEYLYNLVDKSDFKEYREEKMEKYLPDKISFTVSDVYEAFNKWYGRGLKTHIYKAYKQFESVKINVKKVETKPWEKLNEMIGLKDIKNLINEIIAKERIQKYRKDMGIKETNMARHMLFYGTPGTAKTTVARLMGQILKEEGIVENGHVVECGRQDLVGEYVGWTARVVEKKFQEARGGILFIDEAYSLIDDKGLYGYEAINTIVQLMENYRDEVIVILAGYPERMEEFISTNDGLRSRIAFQLNFPDYDAEELLQIMELMLKDHEYTMSDEAKEKCLDIFKDVKTITNYGNGRFVRNFLEQIELNQAIRIARDYELDVVDKEVISHIDINDIPDNYSYLAGRKEKKQIGLN